MGGGFNFGFLIKEIVLDLIWVFLISNMGPVSNLDF
jgi:hypothetical protein